MNKWTTPEMEIALSRFFNPRQNLIIPNVSWGMFNHECDLIVVGASGLVREVEIKISRSDLIKDKEKRHGHFDPMISRLYFAIPEKLVKHIEHIPERAGIIVVSKPQYLEKAWFQCRTDLVRAAKTTGKYHITLDERIALMRLANLRVWGLKETIERLKKRANNA